MPDWRRIVGNRLAGIALESREREEVIEELAAHFDDVYDNLRKQGLTEAEAVRRSLGEVRDWRNLRRRIQIARRKDDYMPKRVTQFWLPCVVTLALSIVLLIPAGHFGRPLRIVSTGGKLRMTPRETIYIPWMLSLSAIGAIGAYFSHRAGGTLRAMLSSALFPVVPILAFLAVCFPLEWNFHEQFARGFMLSSFLGGLIAWEAMLPAAALLGGGLLFHFSVSRRPSAGGALAQ